MLYVVCCDCNIPHSYFFRFHKQIFKEGVCMHVHALIETKNPYPNKQVICHFLLIVLVGLVLVAQCIVKVYQRKDDLHGNIIL